jgi:L-rhamnose mutarotase
LELFWTKLLWSFGQDEFKSIFHFLAKTPNPKPQTPNKLKRLAFKMKLFPGQEAEYKKRHDEIWPELQALLKEAGIQDYSIFLDESTGTLFSVFNVTDPENLDTLPQQEVMKRWWSQMANIMESHEDNSPVSFPLKEVFYLP